MAAVALAVAAPALRPDPPDGFPLSSYPMFSSERGARVSLATAVGITGGGEVVRLDPQRIGGGDEVMLAAATVSRAVAAGPEASAQLCREIADRVAVDGVVAVEVRVETYESVAWFSGDRAPLGVAALATCEVVR